MKLLFAVVYAVALGFGWGAWATRPEYVEAGVMSPTCYTSGKYTKTLSPLRFCAPEPEQTY